MATLVYPTNGLVDPLLMDAYIKFTIFERDNPQNSFPVSSILLFMPERVANANNIDWGPENLMDAAGDVLGAMKDLGAAGIAGKIGKITNSIDRGRARSKFDITSGIVSRLFSPAMKNAASYASGLIVNPYQRMIFKGVNLRIFEFDFKLFPHSKQDVDAIDAIIKEFKRSSVPPGTGDDWGEVMLKYPMEFDIEYIFEGTSNEHLHKIKRCVLTSINTDYTAAGQWAMMRNGAPAETILSLKFQETSIVLRNDVDKGY